jgi:hypothetical protein
VKNTGLAIAGFKMEEGTINKEYRWPPETGKDKAMDSFLESPKRTQPCPHLDFSLVGSMFEF